MLIVKGNKLANLPDTLLKMRTGDNFFFRRSWDHFKNEYKLYKYQKEIGFLSTKDFVINTILRAILRLSPKRIKVLAYKIAR